jgi:hypothetical protein
VETYDATTELFSYGAQAYNLAKPEAIKGTFSTFLGELRDLPRSFNQIGGNLNREFGGGAFLRDLRGLIETQQNMQKHMKQIRRDNGKGVFRSRDLVDEKEVEVLSSEEGQFMQPTSGLPNLPQTRVHSLIRSKHVWYEGKFRYHIPDELLESKWDLRLMAMIHGTEVDAEVVWNLTPWTWLMDWFGSYGDFVANLSSSDYLVQEYGFVMGTQRVTSRYDVTYRDGPSALSLGTYTAWSERSEERKQRVVGSPYAFGLNPISLSARQVDILAALGLSKLGGGDRS